MKEKMLKLIEGYKSLSIPAKASIWFLFCNILQMGLNVMTTPIFTRIMTTDQFGIVNKYNAWRSIIMIFTSLNLSYGVFNNAMVKYEDSKTRDEYISSMQGLYCMITIAFFVVYYIFREPLNVRLGMNTTLVVLLFVELLTYPALLFWSGRQRYEFKYQKLVFVTVFMTIIMVLLNIITVVIFEEKEVAKIGSTVFVNGMIGGFFLIYHFIKGRKIYISSFWKYALAFNVPLIPHYLSEMILSQSDRIMISDFVGDTATANYSVAYSIVLIMQLIMQAISASIVPWGYERLKRKEYKEILKVENALIVLIAGCILVITLFVPEIIYLFAGAKYVEAIYVIPPIALSILFMFFYEMFSLVEFYYEKNIYIMVASVVAAILNVALNYIFIPKYGYYAAGYTTLICYVLYAFAHFCFYRLIARKKMNGVHIFDMKVVLFSAFFMLGVILLLNLVYDKWLVRYLVALLILVVAYIKRTSIIALFQMVRTKPQE